ncbi:hypothetical protein ACFV9G_07075 [Nocardioides sp. NPDC059952]|uniref:hypothetical protein n=1 Tax=Nocardioides sp. NPDC059952 TaxID=3347014 RepID=UPI0036580A12
MTTQPLIYGADIEQPLRELDQLVSFYQEIEVSDRLGVQLILHVPVEAKARREIELFGLEVSGEDVHPGALPIVGGLGGSNFVREHVASMLPAHMRGAHIQRIAAVKFKGGAPQSVFEENLVYKSAAALYDFILESADSEEDDWAAQAIGQTELLEDFERYIEIKNFAAEYVALNWAMNLPCESVMDYAEAVTDGKPVYRMIEIYCPVVCIDSPMHEVDIDDTGAIANFESCDTLITSARISGWRTGSGRIISVRGPEAITTVASLPGLEAMLPSLLDLFSAVRQKFLSLGPEQADRAILEHDFLRAVHQRYVKVDKYRSDLDLGYF